MYKISLLSQFMIVIYHRFYSFWEALDPLREAGWLPGGDCFPSFTDASEPFRDPEKNWKMEVEKISRTEAHFTQSTVHSLTECVVIFWTKFLFAFWLLAANYTCIALLQIPLQGTRVQNHVGFFYCELSVFYKKVGARRYEALSRGRSSPDTSAFWACETPRQ